MRCQYCNENEGKYEIIFDKNCESAIMCEDCAKQFKPSKEIIEKIAHPDSKKIDEEKE